MHGKTADMKRTHIVLLIAIAFAIGALLMLSTDFSTYDTINSARQKQGKFVHLIAKLDKTVPLEDVVAIMRIARDMGARTTLLVDNKKQ